MRRLRRSLLVFRPKPRNNRFLDVGEGFLLVVPLRDASGQCRALGHDPAAFRFGESHMKNHVLYCQRKARNREPIAGMNPSATDGTTFHTRLPGRPPGYWKPRRNAAKWKAMSNWDSCSANSIRPCLRKQG